MPIVNIVCTMHGVNETLSDISIDLEELPAEGHKVLVSGAAPHEGTSCLEESIDANVHTNVDKRVEHLAISNTAKVEGETLEGIAKGLDGLVLVFCLCI